MSDGHCTRKIYVKKIELKSYSTYNVHYLKEIKVLLL